MLAEHFGKFIATLYDFEKAIVLSQTFVSLKERDKIFGNGIIEQIFSFGNGRRLMFNC